MASEIRNPELWQDGRLKIDWVRHHMPLLNGLEEEFRTTLPFKGKKVALSVHLEAKTAYLCEVLAAGGAEMYVTGSNPLSTQDDVAAALVHAGLNVFAWYGATPQEYESHIRRVLEVGPNVIIDDGGDLVNLMHTEYTDLIPEVIGGCEETTTGILRLVQLNNAKALRFPMMLVNNADCKHLFDNRYGTGQSVWDGINRTTNLIVAGKNVVVAGYGWCGKGVAMRAKGLGAEVIVTEVDPIKAMEAVMDATSRRQPVRIWRLSSVAMAKTTREIISLSCFWGMLTSTPCSTSPISGYSAAFITARLDLEDMHLMAAVWLSPTLTVTSPPGSLRASSAKSLPGSTVRPSSRICA